MNESKIAERLTELRNAKGATQEDVAAALSVSNKTISKWENGSSSPDLNMLIALAEYYNVTTDYLLGLDSGKKSVKGSVADMFSGLDRRESGLKLAEITKALFPACYGNSTNTDNGTEDYIPPHNSKYNRYQLSSSAFSNFAVFSENANFAVTLWRNHANFSWLLDEEKQEKISLILNLLADPDAMKIIRFVHCSECSLSFTAEYISKNAGVPIEKSVELLERFCELDSASKSLAHLKAGDITVYTMLGDNLMLAILSIAYERMCGEHGYNYNMDSGTKLIGGKK